MLSKESAKNILGGIPLTAEIYWLLRQGGEPPVGGYHLERVKQHLPIWIAQAQAQAALSKPQTPKKVLIFSMLSYWIEHSLLMGLTLAALGHDVTLAYLPYAQWKRPVNRFDLRRQNLYIQEALKPAKELIELAPFLDAPMTTSLPSELEAKMDWAAFRDTQYSQLREDVDRDSDLYHLRMERNRIHALKMLAQIKRQRPQAVVVPNGSILEFGITYHVAQYVGLPVMTFEFGEQNDRMWLAQNDDVMRQDTSQLWEANRDKPLSDEQWERVKTFFSARQKGDLWETFVRLWQETAAPMGDDIRLELGLDSRPVVFLPTNVLGDSLTLGRQLFSDSMTQWLQRTIEFFLEREDVQFVIKTHPGELIGWGPAVYDILNDMFPDLPEHIHLLAADAKINAYDLVHIADIGLVFTTTMGMEMAMSGLPVIVSGQTHYRGKGFTLDPDSWDSFYEILQRVLANPQEQRPSRDQVEAAWTYAYRFFFEYPQPYPWHVQYFEEDIQRWPLEKVFSDEGMAQFEASFDYLLGKPIDWVK
jgi:hypothetical protein